MQFPALLQLAKFPLYCLILLCLFFPSPASTQPTSPSISAHPHPHAHAHNDYEHDRPLMDALSHGFMSVEADVWLLKGKLYVKHTKPLNLSKTPQLESLYLAPLQTILAQQGGRVYSQSSQPFFLMIDIKAQGEEVYQKLAKLLVPYKNLLLGEHPPIKIFLSGDRPILSALKDEERLVGIDGRPEDLGKGFSADFMPVVSQRYAKVVSWKGKSEISESDFQTLKNLADACHKEGKKLRLWASPETELAWETLLEAGVDLLNTDHLAKLDRFLQSRKVQD